jgi:hypothetical protein
VSVAAGPAWPRQWSGVATWTLRAWALLTVVLGLGYARVVLGLDRLLPQGSSLVVAAATLAMAAVFQPVPSAAASRPRWTGDSTGVATTPPGPSRRSAAGCASRSTRTRHLDGRAAGGGGPDDAAGASDPVAATVAVALGTRPEAERQSWSRRPSRVAT